MGGRRHWDDTMYRPPEEVRRAMLSAETVAILKAHRPVAALFTMGTLEAWRAKHHRGPFELWPRTDGKFVVFDRRTLTNATSPGEVFDTEGKGAARVAELHAAEVARAAAAMGSASLTADGGAS